MKFLTSLFLIVALISCKSEATDSEISSGKYAKTLEKITSAKVPTENYDKFSYALGFNYIVEASKDSLFKLNPVYFILGAIDAVDESNDIFDEKQLNRLRMEFQEYMQNRNQALQEKQKEEFNKRGEVYKGMNDEYIANFKKEHPKYKETKSGVLYDMIELGVGAFPSDKDFVTFFSNGYFMDGIMFDRSLTERKTKQFMLKDFFPGMKEIMEKLNPGAKVVALIPYQQAFGEQGNPPSFPPYATLKMEIEMVKIDQLPEGAAGGLQGLPEGVKIKDVRTRRIPAPQGR